MIESAALGMTLGAGSVFTVLAGLGSLLMAGRRLRLRNRKLTLAALERETLKLWRADRPKKAAVFCAGCLTEIEKPVRVAETMIPVTKVLTEHQVAQAIGYTPHGLKTPRLSGRRISK